MSTSLVELPHQIKIGYRTFQLLARENLPDIQGHVHNDKRIIQIDKSFNSHDKVDTVIHECLHVMIGDSQLVSDDDEEKLVSVLANKLTELFLRNPKLVNWIQQQLKEEIE